MKYLSLLFVLSCAGNFQPTTPGNGVTICLTSCGMRLYDLEQVGSGWTCEAVQRAEDVGRKWLDRTDDTRLHGARFCEALEGWTVKVNAKRVWQDPYGRMVAGLTYCTAKTMEIGRQPPGESSLIHEMAHVGQGCNAGLDVCGENGYYGHECWHTRFIFGAIEGARSEL